MDFFSDQLASNLAASAKSPARPSAEIGADKEGCVAELARAATANGYKSDVVTATADAAAASPTWRHSHLVMTTDRREAREIVREPRFCWRSEIC